MSFQKFNTMVHDSLELYTTLQIKHNPMVSKHHILSIDGLTRAISLHENDQLVQGWNPIIFFENSQKFIFLLGNKKGYKIDLDVC